MTAQDLNDHLALRAVAERYATGVDRRDRDLFISAFHPDASLRVFDPPESDEPISEMRGYEAIGAVIARIARYPRTYHLLGNASYSVDDGTATGEVYCVAHHLDLTDVPTNHVMYIRYRDEYSRRSGDGWQITDRRVLVDSRESRSVDDPT